MPRVCNLERSSINPAPTGPGVKGGPNQAHLAPSAGTILERGQPAQQSGEVSIVVMLPKLKPPTQRRRDGAGPSPYFTKEERRGGSSSPLSMHEEEHIVPEDGLRVREDSTSRGSRNLILVAVYSLERSLVIG